MKRIRIITGILICLSFATAISGAAFLSSNKVVYNEIPEKSLEQYMSAGSYNYDNGQYTIALVNYKNALQLEEDNIEALKGEAECFDMLEYYSDAEKAYGKLAELLPGDIDISLSYINLLIQNGKRDEAKRIVETMLQSSDDEKLVSLYENMNIAAPEFNLKSGIYDSYQILKLEEEDVYSNVYYTLDGSEPNSDSMQIGEELILSNPENHIIAKSIGFLGYESEPVKLDIIIDVPVEKVYDPDSTYDASFLRDIHSALNKSYEEPIYIVNALNKCVYYNLMRPAALGNQPSCEGTPPSQKETNKFVSYN